jgi:hypothetical protein
MHPHHRGWEELIFPLSLLLAAVFIYAGISKFRDPLQFADSIAAFAILPATLINLVALSIPPFEVVNRRSVGRGPCCYSPVRLSARALERESWLFLFRSLMQLYHGTIGWRRRSTLVEHGLWRKDSRLAT